jgi:hypothetical protein
MYVIYNIIIYKKLILNFETKSLNINLHNAYIIFKYSNLHTTAPPFKEKKNYKFFFFYKLN